MLPRDCLAIQFTSFDELVDSTLWGGVEVAHDHAQGVAVALAHNVVHDIQQRPQLGNLHAEKEHQDVQCCVKGNGVLCTNMCGMLVNHKVCTWAN